MPNLGPLEIGLIVLVILLLFGASRLPKLGRSMGQSIKGFKKGLEDEVPTVVDDEPAPVKKAAAPVVKTDDSVDA
jgi:sec-independent protein translocase protein TatA